MIVEIHNDQNIYTCITLGTPAILPQTWQKLTIANELETFK